MQITIQLVIGIALLLTGRRMYWLFAGLVGFLAGMQAAELMLWTLPGWPGLALAAGCAVLALIAAVAARKLTALIAAVIAGAWAAMQWGLFFPQLSTMQIALLSAACALVAGVLAGFFIDAAVMIFSSLLGAALIVDAFGLPEIGGISLSAVLAGLGIIVQMRGRGDNSRSASERKSA